MILEKGRPENIDTRLDKEIRTYDFLDSIGVEYERVDHPAAMTMEACEEIDRVLCATTCKNLFLSNRQGTAFYLLLIPGDKPFKTKDISAQIGSSRLSFGSYEQMESLLGVTPGSCSIFGLMNDLDKDVTLLIDEEIFDGEYVGFHPCINTTTLRIKTSDIKNKVIGALGHRPIYVKLERYTETST